LPNGQLAVNNPEQQAKVAALLASGLNQSQATDHLEISRTSVNRIANLPATQKLIEDARNLIIAKVLPKAVQNVQECVNKAMDTEQDKDTRYWGLRYSEKMMEAIGIMGSSQPSTVITQIFNTQNNLSLSPIIQSIIGSYTDTSDVIDADPTEDTNQ